MARKKVKEKSRAEVIYENGIMNHMQTDYRKARGCRKLGITNAIPIHDPKGKEFLVRGWDSEGPVILTREEALGTVWVPTKEEIEERKKECEFLFPHSHRARIEQATPEPLTIPLVSQADKDAPNRKQLSDY